jgi:tRNA(adenine34) deaminase
MVMHSATAMGNYSQFPCNWLSLTNVSDAKFMRLALLEAKSSKDEVPVGALLVSGDGRIIAKAHNLREQLSDPSAHAEILVLREVARERDNWKLNDCTLYVTLEPCAMCATAISDSRLKRVVFGAWDSKLGAAGSKYDIIRDPEHGGVIEVEGGLLEEECSQLLAEFFRSKRS